MSRRPSDERFVVPVDAIQTIRRARDERPAGVAPVAYHANTDRQGRLRSLFRAVTDDRGLTTSYFANEASGRWLANGAVIERMYGEEAASEPITPTEAHSILQEWDIELDDHDTHWKSGGS